MREWLVSVAILAVGLAGMPALAPGMQHCGGGDAPNVLDPVSALVDWVEAGRAPVALIAIQRRADGTERSRPVCPYPQAASYAGGDPEKAASFVCK